MAGRPSGCSGCIGQGARSLTRRHPGPRSASPRGPERALLQRLAFATGFPRASLLEDPLFLAYRPNRCWSLRRLRAFTGSRPSGAGAPGWGAGWKRAAWLSSCAPNLARGASRLPAQGAVFRRAGRRPTTSRSHSVPPELRYASPPRSRREPRTSSAWFVRRARNVLRALVELGRGAFTSRLALEQSEVLAWLSAEPLERGIIDGPGAALGLCGLAVSWARACCPTGLGSSGAAYAQARFTASLDPEASHTAFFSARTATARSSRSCGAFWAETRYRGNARARASVGCSGARRAFQREADWMAENDARHRPGALRSQTWSAPRASCRPVPFG